MYTKKIMYTKEQCIRLAKIQYYFFGKLRKFFRILLSVIPLIVGVIVGLDSIRGILLLVLGIYVYVKTASIYEIDGEKAYNSIKQNTAPFEYDFFENEFRVRLGEKEKTINYNSIYALVSDEEYIYLFLSDKQAYMVPINPLKKDENDEVLKFLNEKTGKPWKFIRISKGKIRNFLS